MYQVRFVMTAKILTFIVSVMALNSPAYAAGIDSRAYTCVGLQSLIASQGFVFISQATFGDFVVANASSCGGGDVLELRSVATSDRPECTVNYCRARTSGTGN